MSILDLLQARIEETAENLFEHQSELLDELDEPEEKE